MAVQSRNRRDVPFLTMMMHIVMPISFCVLAAALGALLVQPNLGWYAGLNKPSFMPSNETFVVGWLIFYAVMAGALLWVWRSKGKSGADTEMQHKATLEQDRQLAFRWFGVQLALTVFWCFAFFQMRSPSFGMAVMFALLVAVLGTVVVFDRVSRGAALLLIPYFLWVCVATGLNAMILVING